MRAADVLILSPHIAPPPGGIQRLTMHFAEVLGDARVRVVGVSDAASPDPRVRVVAQRRGRAGAVLTNLFFAAACLAELRRRPAVVQAMSWRAAVVAALLPGAPPFVLYCHGAELLRTGGGPINAWARRFVLARARLLVANSHYTAGLVRTLAGQAAVVLHPPVKSVPSDLQPRQHNGGEINVLSVGRLVKNKGHDRLLRAVASARASGADVRVTIVGGGPEHGSLVRLVRELGLDDVARLAGEVSDAELDALYRDADIFSLLSVPVGGEVEGFGMVFLEANAYKLPVVAGRSGGTEDAVADGISGFVVDDHDAATDALTKLANDPELRRRLGESGYDRLAQFSIGAFGVAVRSLYADL